MVTYISKDSNLLSSVQLYSIAMGWFYRQNFLYIKIHLILYLTLCSFCTLMILDSAF